MNIDRLPGTGLCNLKTPGGAMHPDDIYGYMTDGFYEKQLRAYIECTNLDLNDVFCVRDNIKRKILEESAK